MPAYGAPITLVRGEGCRVWAETGGPTSTAGGLGALSLGHAHPRWVAAVTDAASTIGLTTNLVTTLPQALLADGWPPHAGGRRTGVPVQLRRGGERGGAEARAQARARRRTTERRRARGVVPRTDDRDARRDRAAGEARAVRTARGLGPVRAAERRRRARRGVRAGRRGAVLLEPILGEGGIVALDESLPPRRARRCDATERCSPPTRCRRARPDRQVARPGGVGRRADVVDAGEGARRRAADRRPRRAARTSRSDRASTARRSAAVPCRRPPRSRCSTRSMPTTSSRTSPRWARCCARRSRGSAPAGALIEVRGDGLLCGFRVAGSRAASVVEALVARGVLASDGRPRRGAVHATVHDRGRRDRRGCEGARRCARGGRREHDHGVARATPAGDRGARLGRAARLPGRDPRPARDPRAPGDAIDDLARSRGARPRAGARRRRCPVRVARGRGHPVVGAAASICWRNSPSRSYGPTSG